MGTDERGGRVHGVGGFVTPTAYFHTTEHSKKWSKDIEKLSEENEKFCLRVQELESIHLTTQSTPTSAHVSYSRPRLEYDIQSKKKSQDEKMNVTTKVVIEEVNVDDEHKDAIEVIS